jgi:hypothetical protein
MDKGRKITTKIKARLQYFEGAPSEWWVWEDGLLYRRSSINRSLPDAWIPSGSMDGCVFLDRMGEFNRAGALLGIIVTYKGC